MTETDQFFCVCSILAGLSATVMGWLIWKKERKELLGRNYEGIYDRTPDSEKASFCALVGKAFIIVGAGFAAAFGLFLLDAAVLSRLSGTAPPKNGFSLSMEYNRLIHGGAVRWTEMLANVLVFVPFGLFLTEFLASGKKFRAGPRQGLATLFGFVLSLCIESFQLVLRVGVFELTDLVMNTLGTFVGTGVAVVLRRFLLSLALGRNDNKEISSLR